MHQLIVQGEGTIFGLILGNRKTATHQEKKLKEGRVHVLLLSSDVMV